MPILNYTTSISTEKTAAEIQQKLARAKAQAVMSEYDDNSILIAISFRLKTNWGDIMYQLPSNIDGVHEALCDNPRVPKKLRTKEQAARVAWRIIKDWVEAQLAIVEVGQADIKEVFLPYAQDQSGMTLYERLQEDDFKMITHETDRKVIELNSKK